MSLTSSELNNRMLITLPDIYSPFLLRICGLGLRVPPSSTSKQRMLQPSVTTAAPEGEPRANSGWKQDAPHQAVTTAAAPKGAP